MSVSSRTSPDTVSGELVFPVPDFEEGAGFPESKEGRVATKRVLECVYRLVIGTELEMSDPDHVKRPPTGHRRATTGQPSGVHRLIREVRVDCRAAISAYVAGATRSSPSVRSLIRGHYKHVPYGPRSSLRRWQPIEPYWKGPEGAPVAVRPHRLEGEER